MLVNFLLMCVTVFTLPSHNPVMANEIKVMRNRNLQLVLAWSGVAILSGSWLFILVKDLTSAAGAWYFHSTPRLGNHHGPCFTYLYFVN